MNAEELRLGFQEFIAEGISSIAGNDEESTVAILGFTKNDRVDRVHRVEFRIDRSEQAQRRVNTTFIITTNHNQQEQVFPWTANWGLSNKSEAELLLDVSQFMNLKLANSTTETEDDSRLSRIDNYKLPGFQSTINEHFLNFWFPESGEGSSSSKAPNINKIEEVFRNKFQNTWKQVTRNGPEFEVKRFPVIPLKFTGDNEGVEDQDGEYTEEWARFIIVLLCWRFILRYCSNENADPSTVFRQIFTDANIEDQDKKGFFYRCLPELDSYKPTRPVDIDPHKLFDVISGGEDSIIIPWHVLASVSAALNAGKHIIFTGPPGCGKTSLAKQIARHVSNKKELMATASQAWSTDEVIGHYMPTLDGKGLRFKDGFFLKALGSGKWLIIDEINRCDIDNCFGELFTVLAGESVVLPFEKTTEDDSGKVQSLPIKIVVGDDAGEQDKFMPISFSDTFRLLATMNDADVAGLNQLSYALRRRFAIIRVDAPRCEKRQGIFKEEVEEVVYRDLDLKEHIYHIFNSSHQDSFCEQLTYIINKLFATEDIQDLITLKVVGIASVKDIIRFVGEGLRAADPSKKDVQKNVSGNANDASKQLLHSFLAMGLVLNVYPQLDAVTGEIEKKFEPAVQCFLDAFAEDEKFWRIELDETQRLTLVDSGKEIREYLLDELLRQYDSDIVIHDLIEDKWYTKNE